MLKNKPGHAVKLAVIAIVLGAIYFPWKAAANQDLKAAEGKLDIVGFGATMDQRLGNDDGAAFVIHSFGDTRGSLETCGCKGKLSGGMARRVGYLDAFAERFKDIPTLLVDTGGSLSKLTTSHEMLMSYAIAQDDWMIKAYDKFKVDVINVSDREVPYLSSLTPEEGGENAGTSSILDRMISANASSSTNSKISFRPYIIKTVQARQPGGGAPKLVRIGFVGVSDNVSRDKVPVSGVTLADPVETARKTVAAVRDKADVVVVLAHVTADVGERIAKQTNGIDLLLVGNDEIFTPPRHIGNTLMAFTANDGTMFGEARFYRNESGRYSVKERFVGIDTGIPEDTEATAFVAAAKAAIATQVRPLVKAQEAAMASGSAGAHHSLDLGGYVTAPVCARCHADQYASWVNSDHGRAATKLAPLINVMDRRCLQCHTTDYVKGSENNSSRSTALLNVQCEQCHGPGAQHVAKPDKSYGHVDLNACGKCHTNETSPSFSLAADLAKIKH
ncbi:MAG TPA: multiheme c-type cytochrome [Blastocatellia bacterium]